MVRRSWGVDPEPSPAGPGCNMTFNKVECIQYLRAIAVIVVVAWHTGQTHTTLGQSGVDLFFVISGFIMMYITEQDTDPVSFMKSRLLRIVPMYWLMTAVAFFLLWPDAW